MCRAGRSKLYPYMSSMTILCDSPMPSVSLRYADRQRRGQCLLGASTAGCRG